MKRFLAILATLTLVALPVLADGWNNYTDSITPEMTVDQTFYYAFTATGETATHQDFSGCGTILAEAQAGTAMEFFDCPASDSARNECNSVGTLPDVRSGISRQEINVAFPQGFGMIRITDAVPNGEAYFYCTGGSQEYVGSSWGTVGTPRPIDASFELPATTDHVMVKANTGLTLTSLNCTQIGATTGDVVVLVNECNSAGASCVTTGLTVNPVANATNYPDTTPSNASIDAGDWLEVDVTTVTTIPEWLYCTVEATR